ncbi:RNA polymerase III transcription factor IIIC subunit-domain-containing protein [Pseudomassariella vexata]|uniref:RNA polymerase III transcription factor IIIC subunit-domain-containing protein n=1 Tax=Pseudomassariella vexata TaxID=1141098 RepID=A0A1Y2EK07_9PEZI|nr:RNA polymerase III transcription factor IIIC subunit-domain-containing protein [Pseudomassariella vexata]ORY71880.1 RNA polymerase III transcription factor IIIC subunit-domain-containing protein [Pseudomassariella vexata]
MLGLENLFPPGGSKNDGAPYFEVPSRKIVSIEHPFIIQNLDNGIRSFGPNPNFHRLMVDGSERSSLPLWLRHDEPTAKPVMSHNAASNNVLLKITVPKRTGRKRKRGSDEPFSGDVALPDAGPEPTPKDQVCSVARQDNPRLILRKLQDNADTYSVEAVGAIRGSHRYRGLADFQFIARDLPFLSKVADHLTPMNVSKLREFKLDLNQGIGSGQEIIPPPHFTDKVAPFNYFYEQNPNAQVSVTDATGKPIIGNMNRQGRFAFGHYIQYNAPVPTGPLKPANSSGLYQVPADLLDKLRTCMEERPIWTRRALVNQVNIGNYISETAVKFAIQAVGYQFKGGPWRDAVVKYGVDPRIDSKYRIYQTLAFKLHRLPVKSVVHNGQITNMSKDDARRSHMWDGNSYCTNGKFWQVCDITDAPLLQLIEEAPLREECAVEGDGWWYEGTWSKVKAYMKAKMVAIQAGRLGDENDVPKKPGYLYASSLVAKLKQHADIVPVRNGKFSTVNVTTLLYGLEDVEGLEGIRYRHRPGASWKDPYGSMGLTGNNKYPVRRKRRAPSSFEGGERDAPEAGGNGEKRGGEVYPDDAWAHILDSDLSDMSGDEDGNEADETMVDEAISFTGNDRESRNGEGDDEEFDEEDEDQDQEREEFDDGYGETYGDEDSGTYDGDDVGDGDSESYDKPDEEDENDNGAYDSENNKSVSEHRQTSVLD